MGRHYLNLKDWQATNIQNIELLVEPVKLKYSNTHFKMRTDKYGTRLIEIETEIEGVHMIKNANGTTTHKLLAAIERPLKYQLEDILLCRESYTLTDWGYEYKSDTKIPSESNDVRIAYGYKWKSPILMPTEAIRHKLTIKNINIKRIQELTDKEIEKYGITLKKLSEAKIQAYKGHKIYWKDRVSAFIDRWNSNHKNNEHKYENNPWCVIYEVERVV